MGVGLNSSASAMLRAAALVVVAAVALRVVDAPGSNPDFVAFWAAAQGGGSYDPVTLGSFLRGVVPAVDAVYLGYPPTALLFFEPLDLLPYRFAFVAWVVVSAAALLWSQRSAWVVLLVLSPPIAWALFAGQVSIFVGVALYLGLANLRRPILAGVLIGAGMCLKPQIGFLLPLGLLAAREWRAFLGVAATGLLLAGAATLAYGPGVWAAWLHALPALVDLNHANLADRMVAPWLPMWAHLALLPAGAALVFVAFRRDDLPTRLTAVVLASLLVSPYALRYDIAAAAPAAFLLALRRDWRLLPSVAFLALPGTLLTLLLIAATPWLPKRSPRRAAA